MKNTKDWTGNSKTAFVGIRASNHSTKERHSEDFYATPPQAIDDLFAQEEFDIDIWEPACGQGHLSKRMKELGKKVLSTDLVDRGYGNTGVDFLGNYLVNREMNFWDGDIITNPPYKIALEFLDKALQSIEFGAKVAFFLKIQFLEGQKRRDFFKRFPPKVVYVYSHRMSCAMNGEFEKYTAAAMCHCWFVWEKGFTGDPIIKWIE